MQVYHQRGKRTIFPSAKEGALLKLAQGTLLASASIGIAKLAGFIIKIILSRFGATALGSYALSIAVFDTVVMIAALGIPLGVTRYVSFFMGKENRRMTKSVIYSALAIVTPIAMTIPIAIFIYATPLSKMMNSPSIAVYLRIFALIIPLAVYGKVFKGALLGALQVKQLFFIESVLESLTKILLVGGLILLGFGVFGAIVGFAASIAIASIVAAALVRKQLGKIKTSKPYIKELTSYSWPVALSEILAAVILRADRFLLGVFGGSGPVGLYDAAFSISGLMLIVPSIILPLFLPITVKLHAKKQDFTKFYRVVTKWMFTVLFPAFIIFIIVPKSLIATIFGQEYTQAFKTLSTLAFANLVFGVLTRSGRQILDMLEHTRTNLIFTLVRATAMLTSFMYLIPKLGGYGAALGTALAITGEAALVLVVMYRLTGTQIFSWNLVKIATAAVVPAAILVVPIPFSVPVFVQLFLRLAFYGVVYVGIYTRFLMDNMDREFIGALQANFARRKKQ